MKYLKWMLALSVCFAVAFFNHAQEYDVVNLGSSEGMRIKMKTLPVYCASTSEAA